MDRLTDEELERLALLSEECAEVIAIIGKILRHGYESSNPFDARRTRNRELLAREIGDVRYSIRLLCQAGDISEAAILTAEDAARQFKPQYLHHQKERQ